MKTTNYYADKSNKLVLKRKKKLSATDLSLPNQKNEKWKETAKDVSTDVLVGVLGGGLAAATIGRSSFLVGLTMSAYGHHTENKSLSALGLGMMASGSMTALNSQGKTPEMPERLKLFQDELKRKLFLDKLTPTNKPTLSGTETKKTPTTPTQPNPISSEIISREAANNLNKESVKDISKPLENILEDENDYQWDFKSNGILF